MAHGKSRLVVWKKGRDLDEPRSSWNVSFGKHREERMCDVVLREIRPRGNGITSRLYVMLAHVTW
jgi:hypothetical protein